MKVLVINGPNLNLLGTREPEIYGSETLDSIAERCVAKGKGLGLEVVFQQSNHEGEIIDWIHQAIKEAVEALVINAGAYTHTSVAIHDALKAYNGYKIELHISNPHLREAFRHTSYVSLVVDDRISGQGVVGYEQAITTIAEKFGLK